MSKPAAVLAVLLSAASAIADEPLSVASTEPSAPPPGEEAQDEKPRPAADAAPLEVKPVALLDERLILAPGKGLTAKTADGTYSLTLRARAQLRDTYVHDTLDTNELNIRTLRVVLQGNVLTPELKFLVQLALAPSDFEAGNPSPVYDAYIEYTRWRDFNVRAGQFLLAFDRARTVRELALQMVDRQATVRELSLDRDVGLMVSSNDLFGLKQLLSYAFFVGGGDGKNRVGAQMAGPLLVMRLAVRPFGAFDDDAEGDLQREPRPRLSIGVAGGYNLHSTRGQSTLGTVLTLGTFDYVHAAADVTFKCAGFSLLAEGLLRQATGATVLSSGTAYEYGLEQSGRPVKDASPNVEYARSGWGYFVQAGYMVTSLVEVTARWDQLFALPGTDPALATLASTQGRQVGAGANVYLNGHAFKLQADYFYIWGSGATPGRHAARVALDASF